ncbi:atrial natriuretic peptide receptor 1-like [Paramacrobiotus metropolitanus]|uniref:atrial natriuretic peptide receptor 1-like n=1 Tax=Paramacrobiotus metropolitanus TaxID=2943436 RepID=UPI0024461C8E|nr:atrial natriuretic peptide receptor 1-like [Paramacrobiotus metropolitanus]
MRNALHAFCGPLWLISYFGYLILSVLPQVGYVQSWTEDTGSVRKRNLNVCLILENPLQEALDQFFSYRRTAAALDLAVENVNTYILSPANMQLVVWFRSGGDTCDSAQDVISGGLSLITQGVTCNLYIGAGCGNNADALYSFAEYYKVPLIAIPAAGLETTGPTRDTYKFLARTSYTFDDVCSSLIQILQLWGYLHTTVFTDDSQSFFHELSDAFVASFDKYSPNISLHSRFVSLSSGSNLLDSAGIVNRMLEASTSSRVFILLFNATIVRDFMLKAKRLGMTDGSYVYFAIELFPSNYWGSYTWKTGQLNDQEAREAYDSLFVLSLIERQSPAFEVFSTKVRVRSQEKFNYTFGMFEPIDSVVTSYYEAIFLYGTIIKKLWIEEANVSNGELVAKTFKNFNYTSELSGNFHMDKFGDRDNDYVLKDLDEVTGAFRPSLKYNVDLGLQVLAPIQWPNRSTPPPDVPWCGFKGEAIVCQALMSSWNGGLTAVVAIVPLLALAGIIGGIVYSVHRRAQAGPYDPYWWKILVDELQVHPTGPAASFHSRNSELKSEAVGSKSTRSRSNKSFVGSFFDNRAFYQGVMVAVRDISKIVTVTASEMVDDMRLIRECVHDNIHKVIGIAVSPSNVCMHVVAELASHGSIQDVLTSDAIRLDWSFKNSIISDIVMGMDYLHLSTIQSHGALSALTCVVDRRFAMKVSDAGLWRLRDPKLLLPPQASDKERDYEPLLYRAPELLRGKMPPKGSQKGDVYSFAIILQQIILRGEAYETPGDNYALDLTKHEIAMEVQKGTDPPFRPRVPRVACPNELYRLMENCWSEYPTERPSFVKIKQNLHMVIGKVGDNIVDHLLKRMEEYAEELQQQVAEKTDQFMEEKRRSEELLGQLLPKSVAQALTKGQSVNPEAYESVSIYFSDIVEFTKISASGTPMEVIQLLNNLYTVFDAVIEHFDVYKVETIGDAYMVCSGLPVRNGNRHVVEIAKMSLQVVQAISNFEVPQKSHELLRVRIGVHSGPCVAGIVGLKMPRYCLFGDTVNTASRMESSGEANKIHISEQTYLLLEDNGSFIMEKRGPVEIKGKGIMVTYWLIKML